MGLISRVSSRTYRSKKMFLTRTATRALKFSATRGAAIPDHNTYNKTLNEHGGWICTTKEEWAKWWPELAEKRRLHNEQMHAHIPVHMQGKYGKMNGMFDMVTVHASFAFSFLYGTYYMQTQA